MGLLLAGSDREVPKPVDATCGLLRTRGQRKTGRPASKCDELAPLHSITSSARAMSDGGTLRPIALAVLRFITNSNFVG
jgi:hypothetical protein